MCDIIYFLGDSPSDGGSKCGLATGTDSDVAGEFINMLSRDNQKLVFTIPGGSAVSVSEIEDRTSGLIRMTLSVAKGSLTLGTTCGLMFLEGDGSEDATMTFVGQAAAIDAALNGLRFTPSGADGRAESELVRVPERESRARGNTSESHGVASKAPASQAPVSHALRGLPPGLLFETLDAPNGEIIVSLGVPSGTLTLGCVRGLYFEDGDGIANTRMRFRGRPAEIDAALEGLKFDPRAQAPAKPSSKPEAVRAAPDQPAPTSSSAPPKSVLEKFVKPPAVPSPSPPVSGPPPPPTPEEVLDLRPYAVSALRVAGDHIRLVTKGNPPIDHALAGLTRIRFVEQDVEVLSADTTRSGFQGMALVLAAGQLVSIELRGAGCIDWSYCAATRRLTFERSRDTDAESSLRLEGHGGAGLSVERISLSAPMGLVACGLPLAQLQLHAGGELGRLVVQYGSGTLNALAVDGHLTSALAIAGDVKSVAIRGALKAPLCIVGTVGSIDLLGKIEKDARIEVGKNLETLTSSRIEAGAELRVGGHVAGIALACGAGARGQLARVKVGGTLGGFTASADSWLELEVGERLLTIATIGRSALGGRIHAAEIGAVTIGGDLCATITSDRDVEVLRVVGDLVPDATVESGGSCEEVSVQGRLAGSLRFARKAELVHAKLGITGVIQMHAATGRVKISDGASTTEQESAAATALVYDPVGKRFRVADPSR
ncbi:MAG: hypothetical protein ACKVX7_08095 [Planctomycetota bacterium]